MITVNMIYMCIMRITITYDNRRMSCYVVLCYVVLHYVVFTCYVMLCYGMSCRAVPCYAVLCRAMPCYAVLRHAMPCYARGILRCASCYVKVRTAFGEGRLSMSKSC